MSEKFDVRNLSLQEWLALVYDPPDRTNFINIAFPTNQHQKEYIETINQRSVEDVKSLLFLFLMKTGSVGLLDEIRLQSLPLIKEKDPEMFERMMGLQFYKRLILYFSEDVRELPPWEGVTWILDLLPYYPKLAIEGLTAYITAHIQLLPDWRLKGAFDALEIIRAKFIGIPKDQKEKIDLLLGLDPRDFEHLVERLYKAMNFITKLTPPQKDGGRDIIAVCEDSGKRELLRIECKRYTRPLTVELVRSLLGVVSDEKVNKGVIVTTGNATKYAIEFVSRNPRLEIICGSELVVLMNKHLGYQWSIHIDRHILESKKAYLNNP